MSGNNKQANSEYQQSNSPDLETNNKHCSQQFIRKEFSI